MLFITHFASKYILVGTLIIRFLLPIDDLAKVGLDISLGARR